MTEQCGEFETNGQHMPTKRCSAGNLKAKLTGNERGQLASVLCMTLMERNA